MRRLFLTVLALAACSGSLGGKDAGPGTIVGAGGARLDAPISTGGTGLDDAGVPTGSGGGSWPNCPSGEGAPALFGQCDSSGTVRSGWACYADGTVVNWTVICCSGFWQQVTPSDARPISCPTLQPGDRFACGSAGLTCAAGESYCYEHNDPNTQANLASCEPLCAAGDCTCFCTDPFSCNFRPQDAICMRDSCRCEPPRASNSLLQPGGVHVTCSLDRLPIQQCAPTGDACNADGDAAAGAVYHCEDKGWGPPNSTCVMRQYGIVCDAYWVDWCCAS